MKWQPGQSGNPFGRGLRERPVRDALRLELAANELGEPAPVKYGTYRAIARSMIYNAMNGDVAAFEAIANRIDGKVPQGVIGGDDEDNPLHVVTRIERIERIIVTPEQQNARTLSAGRNGGSLPAPSETSPL